MGRVPLEEIKIGECFAISKKATPQIVVGRQSLTTISQTASGETHHYTNLTHKVVRISEERFLTEEFERQKNFRTAAKLRIRRRLESFQMAAKEAAKIAVESIPSSSSRVMLSEAILVGLHKRLARRDVEYYYDERTCKHVLCRHRGSLTAIYEISEDHLLLARDILPLLTRAVIELDYKLDTSRE